MVRVKLTDEQKRERKRVSAAKYRAKEKERIRLGIPKKRSNAGRKSLPMTEERRQLLEERRLQNIANSAARRKLKRRGEPIPPELYEDKNGNQNKRGRPSIEYTPNRMRLLQLKDKMYHYQKKVKEMELLCESPVE